LNAPHNRAVFQRKMAKYARKSGGLLASPCIALQTNRTTKLTPSGIIWRRPIPQLSKSRFSN